MTANKYIYKLKQKKNGPKRQGYVYIKKFFFLHITSINNAKL